MADKKHWIVTTSGERSPKDVARDLERAGFTVEQVHDEIQSIIGSAEEESLARIRNVPGVTDVTADVPIEIGPPDSDETW